MSTNSCTFCDLIRGSAEVSICHEDADSIAFMDIQPVNNGHVLVVPREHYESLLDVPADLSSHLFSITLRIATAVRKVTGCEGLNIVVNSGKAAGQDEPHYHVHIIPRREGDGFDIPLPFNGSSMPDRTVLDAYATRIISVLGDPARVGGVSGTSGGHSSAHQTAAGDEDDTDRGRKTVERRAVSNTMSNTAVQSERAEREVALDGRTDVGSRARLADVFEASEDAHAAESAANVQEGAHGELVYEPRDGESGR